MNPNVTVVSAVAPENAWGSMRVTLAGIVMLVTANEPENALIPMLVTLAGITTEPRQLPPECTTPSVIVKFGFELVCKPVLQS